MNHSSLGIGLIASLVSVNCMTMASNFIGPDWMASVAVLSGLLATVCFIDFSISDE